MRTSLPIRSGQGDYSADFFESVEDVLSQVGKTENPVVLIDRKVAKLYEDPFSGKLEGVRTLLLDATEEEKSLEGAKKVLGWLQESGSTKRHHLIAVGGG